MADNKDRLVTLLDSQTKPIFPYTTWDAVGSLSEDGSFKTGWLKNTANMDPNMFIGSIKANSLNKVTDDTELASNISLSKSQDKNTLSALTYNKVKVADVSNVAADSVAKTINTTINNIINGKDNTDSETSKAFNRLVSKFIINGKEVTPNKGSINIIGKGGTTVSTDAAGTITIYSKEVSDNPISEVKQTTLTLEGGVVETGKYIAGLTLTGSASEGYKLTASKATDQKGTSGTDVNFNFTDNNKNRLYGVHLDNNKNAFVNVPWTEGGGTDVKFDYKTNDKNYAVQLDSNKNAYVNVPWEGGGGVASSVDWKNIANKPDKFAPSKHTHKQGEIEGLDKVLSDMSGSISTLSGLIEDPNNHTILENYTPDPSGKPTSAIYTPRQNSNLTEINTEGKFQAKSGFFETSDKRLKNIIDNIDFNKVTEFIKSNASDAVNFTWKNDEAKEPKNNIGFIAQEVEQYFPEFVSTNSDGFKSVDYAKLSVVLFPIVKDLLKRVEELENKA